MFHEQRKLGIGGSEVAAILGKSEFKTAYEIWADKISTEIKEFDSEAMSWGRRHESNIIAAYADTTGAKINRDNLRIASKKHPFLIGNIDAWAFCEDGEERIIEAKSTKFWKGWGNEWTNEIPIDYLYQVAHYCLIASEFKDIESVHIAALGLTNEFKIFEYKRNKSIEEEIIAGVDEFWNKHVLEKIPPKATTISDAKAKYPISAPDKEIVLDFELELQLRKLAELRSKISTFEHQKKELEALAEPLEVTIRDYIGDAEIIKFPIGNDVCATCKTTARTMLNSTVLKEKMPEVYKQFTKTTSYRTLKLLEI